MEEQRDRKTKKSLKPTAPCCRGFPAVILLATLCLSLSSIHLCISIWSQLFRMGNRCLKPKEWSWGTGNGLESDSQMWLDLKNNADFISIVWLVAPLDLLWHLKLLRCVSHLQWANTASLFTGTCWFSILSFPVTLLQANKHFNKPPVRLATHWDHGKLIMLIMNCYEEATVKAATVTAGSESQQQPREGDRGLNDTDAAHPF